MRIDAADVAIPETVRFPGRLSEPEFYKAAYPLMFLSRRMEDRLLELFQKGYVKGTVTQSARQRGHGGRHDHAAAAGA